MYKIIGADGNEYGPVSAEQLRQWVAEARVDANTRVRAEGSEEWKPLSAYPGLVTSLSQISPLPVSVPLTSSSPRTNSMAVTGLIFGSISLVIGWFCCGPLFSTLGIVFSCIGISQINKSQGMQTGKGMAVAGLVTSILGLFVYVAIIIMFGAIGFLGSLQEHGGFR